MDAACSSGAAVTSREVLRLGEVAFVRDGRVLLDGINFRAGAGDHWALLGPNGAGKSTLLSLCGAVSHPTRGSVAVLGRKLGRVDVRELRESIGHVSPHHPLTSPLSVRQVVLTGATSTTQLVPRWSPTMAVIERADSLIDELGLTRVRDSRWPVLSHGERGRVLIARALMPSPSLLLLDEPAAGLDVAAREQLLATIDRLHATQPSLTTVLVTHHLEELPASTTHAALLRDGRLLASGTAGEVLTSANVTACFDHPIDIEYRRGRWFARAGSADQAAARG